jgi:very-short-patch-repair endonuclease
MDYIKNNKNGVKRLTTEQFIEKANKIHNNKYDYSLVNYKNAHTTIEIICPIHGIFPQLPCDHTTNKSGCSKCGRNEQIKKRKYTTEKFIKKAQLIHGDKYDYSLVDYVNNNTNVLIICPIHGEFLQRPDNHYHGEGCFKCGKISMVNKQKIPFNELIEKFNKIHNNKYDYSLVKYVNMDMMIDIICPIHGKFTQSSSNHLHKHGCPDCTKNRKSTTEKFIEKSQLIHGDKYDYSLVNYINAHKNIKIRCKEHNYVFDIMPNNHIHIKHKRGCPICKESSGERIIRRLLEDNNIKYDRQKRFDDCKYRRTLPFDFYLPQYNICIEFDGEQHSNENHYFNEKNNYSETIKKDQIKTEYCKNSNIKLIRIKYSDNILDKLYFLKENHLG